MYVRLGLTKLTNAIDWILLRAMTTVNLYQAKTALSKLVDQAAAGEEIVIAKAGKPKAKLVPVEPPAVEHGKREWGNNLLGVTYIAPDFNDPVWTDEELDAFGF